MSESVPLIAHYVPERVIAWRDGAPVRCAEAWAGIRALAARLDDKRDYLNLCEDRLYFTLAFAAVALRGGCNLLPQSRAEGAIHAVTEQRPGCGRIDDHAVRDALETSDGDDAGPPPALPGDRLAAIVFTSGTTGPPRPNPKRWRDLLTGTRLAEQRLFDSEQRMNIVATVPPQHMYGLETSVLTVLLGGDAAHNGRPFLPWELRDALHSVPAPRVLVTTPLHLDTFLRSGLEMPPLRRVISATASLSPAIAQRCEQQWHTRVDEIYGCTEAGSLASRHTMSEDSWQLYDGMRLQPEGTGMLLSGPQLPEPVLLDDRIALLGASRFRLMGRSTEMIKVAGKRLALNELSTRLLAIPGVEDAAILPPDPEHGRPRPAAAVVAPELAPRAIAARLAREVDPVFVPRPIVCVARLPRNAVGKLPRSALSALIMHHDKERQP